MAARFLFSFAVIVASFGCWTTVNAVAQDRQSANEGRRLFDQLDRNKNGFVERQELGRRVRLLERLDSNRDDRLSYEEVNKLQARVQELKEIAKRRPANSEPIEVIGQLTEQMPFDLASCQRAAQYNAAANGKSLLIMYDGAVVYEHYNAEGSPETAWELASGTKSFSGVIAMLLVQDGLCTLDERVSDTLTEWQSDDRKRQITLNQLLHLTSGLKPELSGPLASPTWEDALMAPLEHTPGTKFEYGPVAFQCFGEFVARKLSDRKQGPREYLTEKVFQPIGLECRLWRDDANGNPLMPAGVCLTAREWAKFGEFVRLGGAWQGQQILKTELLDQCFVGTKQNPAYGLTFWLGKHRGLGQSSGIAARLNRSEDLTDESTTPNDLVMANGLGGQRLFISRQAKLVIVRQSDAAAVATRQVEDHNWSDREFLKLLSTKED
jgi:CubicO group peptidase (beta-lactamase class C family)